MKKMVKREYERLNVAGQTSFFCINAETGIKTNGLILKQLITNR